MHDGGDPLEAHSGVDVLGREGREVSVAVRVELDEHEIPNLDAMVGIGVDELPFALAIGRKIEVEFATGPAGTRLTHHPKVILLVAHHDVDCGIETGFLEDSRPDGMGFLVEFGRVTFAGLVNGRVESFRWEFPNVNK